MKRLSWKAINAWIMFGLLLAPGLYLFGGYIGQLAGSHGKFMYAEPAIEGGVDYSVEYNGNTYQRLGYVDYSLNYMTTFNLSFEPKTIVLGSTDGEFRGTSAYSPGSVITVYYESPFEFNLDDLDLYSDSCVSWLCYTDLDWIYQELFFSSATRDYESFTWQWDSANQQWVYVQMDPFNSDYVIEDHFGSFNFINQTMANPLPFPTGAHIPQNQPTIIAAPAIEQNAQGNTEFQQGQFFSRNNFLKKWGDSVVSQEETWGFAPFKALIQYLDDNMLHFAPNGVQYGLMAYGYMYYALHIVLLDLVFFIASFFPRFIKKIVGKLEGGIE